MYSGSREIEGKSKELRFMTTQLALRSLKAVEEVLHAGHILKFTASNQLYWLNCSTVSFAKW